MTLTCGLKSCPNVGPSPGRCLMPGAEATTVCLDCPDFVWGWTGWAARICPAVLGDSHCFPRRVQIFQCPGSPQLSSSISYIADRKEWGPCTSASRPTCIVRIRQNTIHKWLLCSLSTLDLPLPSSPAQLGRDTELPLSNS